MKKIIYKILTLTILWIVLLITPFSIKAQENLTIIQELDEDERGHVNYWIEVIWWWNVWENYRLAVKKLSLSERWAAWILGWEDILLFFTLLAGFLSQLWLIIWVIFIMYAWYKYMLSVFNGWSLPTSTVKNAIIWVIIVIFSYAIFRILTSFAGIS